jgi:HK97 family phage prohead protease
LDWHTFAQRTNNLITNTMPDKKLTFVLNDETKVNSYRFRVKNEGLNLDRFKANPVMLIDHNNNVFAVIGRWENVRIEGSQLLADADFDEEDEQLKGIIGKVKRGYIKGCSIGFMPGADSFEMGADDIWDCLSGELMEATICAIPSNAGAVRLYAEPGKLMPEGEIKLCLKAIDKDVSTTINKQNQTSTMDKILLTPAALVALCLPNADNAMEVSKAIEKLAAENTTLKGTNKTLTDQVEAQAKLQAKALVEPAILAGKITADQKEHFTQLAASNYELASTILNGMPAKTSLSAKLSNPTGESADDPKTMDDFMKLPLEKQLSFKSANPEGYQKLFAA